MLGGSTLTSISLLLKKALASNLGSCPSPVFHPEMYFLASPVCRWVEMLRRTVKSFSISLSLCIGFHRMASAPATTVDHESARHSGMAKTMQLANHLIKDVYLQTFSLL